jgi:hypothetical protein
MDIVERLREGKSAGGYWREKEAADEIERLRQYISELEDAISSNNPTEIFNKSARLEGLLTALKEKE